MKSSDLVISAHYIENGLDDKWRREERIIYWYPILVK